MTPLPHVPDVEHTAMNHRIYMAEYNRRMARQYRRRPSTYGKDPTQFHWHMREAIRWIQVEKQNRKNGYGPEHP